MADKIVPVTDSEWEVVKEESGEPIKFDKIGDVFVGVFNGTTLIEFVDPKEGAQSFNQHRFTDLEGKARVLNGGFQMDKTFADIAAGKKVRITHTALVDVGQPSKMKDYRVEIAR